MYPSGTTAGGCQYSEHMWAAQGPSWLLFGFPLSRLLFLGSTGVCVCPSDLLHFPASSSAWALDQSRSSLQPGVGLGALCAVPRVGWWETLGHSDHLMGHAVNFVALFCTWVIVTFFSLFF